MGLGERPAVNVTVFPLFVFPVVDWFSVLGSSWDE